jgi:predicted dienelactone hydrolase
MVPDMWRNFVAALALIVAAPAIAEECATTAVGYRTMHLAGRVVAVWYPTMAAAAVNYPYTRRFSGAVSFNAPPHTVCGHPVPLIVFSHGDLGCGLQSIAFTEELARHGYVVAAPDHKDAFLCHTAGSASDSAGRAPQPNFFKPETWNDTTFVDRRDDIEATIDGLTSTVEFQGVIDQQVIGASGHSLGGYSVVAMAGGWPTWVDPRIKAVLALSPYVMPFQVQGTLGGVRVPLMYQGGTLDIGITPFLKGANGAYQHANPPAFLVELRGAGHFAWVKCGNARTTQACLATEANARLIAEYGIAFFDAYLKHKSVLILSKNNPELADFQFRLPKD